MEKMVILYLSGSGTYGIKEELKADGFRWDRYDRAWSKRFFLDEPGICVDYVKNLAESFEVSCPYIEAEITGDID